MSVPGVPELEWVSVDVLLSLTRTDTVKSDTSSVVTSAGDELEDAGGLGYLVNEVLTCEGSTQPVCRASLVAILDGGVSGKATATWRVRADVRDPDITGGIIPEWAFLELTSHARDGS